MFKTGKPSLNMHEILEEKLEQAVVVEELDSRGGKHFNFVMKGKMKMISSVILEKLNHATSDLVKDILGYKIKYTNS